jgi:hypothetical protein
MNGPSIDRRHVLKVLSVAGVGSVAFGRALTALAADAEKVTDAMIGQAAWIAGIPITDEQRKLMLDGINEAEDGYAKVRAVAVGNAIPPAFSFDPTVVAPPVRSPLATRKSATTTGKRVPLPGTKEEIAFAPVTLLSEWLRHKSISSTELTKLYLERIERLDPKLFAVITLTPERALEHAKSADAEIAKGRWRGRLHGVPYGAKDLLAVAG